MYATLIAILLSAYLTYAGVHLESNLVLFLSVFAAGLFVISSFIILSLSFASFQKEEQNLTPRLLQILSKDPNLKLRLILSAMLPVVFLGVSFFPEALQAFIILFGISIDTLFSSYHRITEHLNPFKVIDFIYEDGKKAIIRDEDAKLCELIEASTEIANKSIHRQSSALAKEAIDTMEKLGELFLNSEASIFHPSQNPELKSQGIRDTISYVFVFLLQHLEDIYHSAFDRKLDLVASYIITAYTKLATRAAIIDLSLTTLPLHYINKTSLKSLQRGSIDIGVKATLGILQIAKSIAEAKDVAYQDIKPPFITMMSTLKEISTETFRKDKKIQIPLLMHPFVEIQRLFSKEPLKSHQDTPVILVQLNQILDEFKALQEVLAMKPPLPDLTIEEATRETQS